MTGRDRRPDVLVTVASLVTVAVPGLPVRRR